MRAHDAASAQIAFRALCRKSGRIPSRADGPHDAHSTPRGVLHRLNLAILLVSKTIGNRGTMMSLGPRPVLSPGKEVGVWAVNAGGHDVITGQRLGPSTHNTVAVSGANPRTQGAPATVWFRQVPARRTLTIRQVHWSVEAVRGLETRIARLPFKASKTLISSFSFASATHTRAAGRT